MPTKTFDADTAGDRVQTLLDWTRLNSRWLTIGGVIVVVAAGGYWFYTRSQEIQARNAETALNNARQAMSAGNLPLAQSDLQQVYSKYGSTPAGVEAAMLIAQIDYDAGKNQDGIAILQKASGRGAASYLEPTLRSLEGDGYAQLGKPVDAAKQYAAAADATPYKNEKASYEAKAARAYQAANDTANARKIWASLATDPDAKSMATEARVRLGELTARVATK